MFAEDRFRFLMDAARMRDLTVELEGVHQGEEGAVATVARTVMFDEDGREINREPWLRGTSVCVLGARAAQLEHGIWGDMDASVKVARRDGSWRVVGALGGGLSRDAGNRAIARLLVGEEIGLVTNSRNEWAHTDALAREAALRASDEQREHPAAVLEFARREPTVLLDPDWFRAAQDADGCEHYWLALEQVLGSARELVDESLGETLYVKDGSLTWHVRGEESTGEAGRLGALGKLLADERPLPTGDMLKVADDCGRLVITNLDSAEGEEYELRIGQDVGDEDDPAAIEAAWESARDVRLADFLGVPQPNLAAVGLTREPAREAGVKEIRAGDRVVSAWCADQRDLVSSDGQDAVEYGACDDDVLEGERRALGRRADDADMDGIADGAEVDADHDGLPDVWELER